MKKSIALLTVLTGIAATTAPAQSLYDWSFTATGGAVDGSGTMVVDTSPADYTSNGGYLVESISGTYLGQTISGLVSVGNYNGNDNLLQNLVGIPPFQIDSSGVAFYYGSLTEENFRFTEVGDYENQNGNSGVFSAVPDLAPVPESPVNPELVAAAGLIIVGLRWRTMRVARA